MIRCFYHKDDLDGICSGAIVKYYCSGEPITMYPITYTDPFPWDDIQKGDIVYMVDFALQPYEDMAKLNNMCNLIWIDHHKSAIKALKKVKLHRKFTSVNKAGCELAWEYFYKDSSLPFPAGVRLLGRYDVWDLDSDENVLPFQYGVRAINPDVDSDFWISLLNDKINVDDFVASGEVILSYIKQTNKKLMLQSFSIALKGYLALCVNSPHPNSQLFESKWDDSKYGIMLTFSYISPDKWIFSIYSTDVDIDCSEIATEFGGGGHSGAAGFNCDTKTMEAIISGECS